MTLKYNSLPRKTLAEPLTSSATSFRLNNIKKWDGTNLAAADFGTEAYGVLRDAKGTVVEFFAFDPATIANADIDFTYRGLAYNGENLTTPITANKLTWGKGSVVELGTHGPQIFQWLQELIEGIAISGSPDATLTQKGLVELATAAEIDAGTATGSTGAGLAVAPDQLELSKYAVLLGSLTGVILPYGSATAPTGFLLCDGSAVSRTTYATLFAITSTSYGVGDGTTTFNVPNLKGRFPLGYSASAPTKVFTFASRASNVITVTGADNHAHNELQTGQAVLYTAASGAMTGLTHNTTYYVIRVSATTFSLATSVANANAGTVIALSSDGTGAQTFTATYTARPIGQTGGEETHALTDAEMPSHNHAILTYWGSAGSSRSRLMTENVTGRNDTPIYTNIADVNQPYIGATGSDTPHNNMPLFTVVNYIIKT